MFGKAVVGIVGAGMAVEAFQSPCAGNMFGKSGRQRKDLCGAARLGARREVSIPVCGEHVW